MRYSPANMNMKVNRSRSSLADGYDGSFHVGIARNAGKRFRVKASLQNSAEQAARRVARSDQPTPSLLA